jgi:hypothetical protein
VARVGADLGIGSSGFTPTSRSYGTAKKLIQQQKCPLRKQHPNFESPERIENVPRHAKAQQGQSNITYLRITEVS